MESAPLKLPSHGRYDHSSIVGRPRYEWPGGRQLAFYIALNIEHFAFGAGLGMDPHNRGSSPAAEALTTGRQRLCRVYLLQHQVAFWNPIRCGPAPKALPRP